MLRIRATNRTIVGYVRCARFPQMQALASLFACGQPEGVHAAGGTASPRRVPEKEKEPDKIGFVFFNCGGDEGGRTPYLLNAIQALYQLSYTPKADNKRKYTIFTSFCQLHLNKWVKCLEQIFCVFDTFAVRACTRCAHLIKDKHCLVLIIYILYTDIYYIRKVFYA